MSIYQLIYRSDVSKAYYESASSEQERVDANLEMSCLINQSLNITGLLSHRSGGLYNS